MAVPYLLSPLSWINALAAVEPADRTADIAYRGALKLDVYTPRSGAAPWPVVVFIHGGGWDSGDRGMYRFAGAALAAQGFVAVVPSYRIFPEGRFPDFIEDAAAAVGWTADHIGGFGGDPRRLVLMGHSAGAHIAAMLSFDRQWLGQVALDPDRALRGFVGLSGPYDFLPLHSDHLRDILGPESGLWRTQPINFVDRRVVPSFIATGARDTVVDPANSTRLAARIRTYGGAARLVVYPRAGHTLIGAFSPMFRPLAPVLSDSARFISEIAAPEAAAIASEPAI